MSTDSTSDRGLMVDGPAGTRVPGTGLPVAGGRRCTLIRASSELGVHRRCDGDAGGGETGGDEDRHMPMQVWSSAHEKTRLITPRSSAAAVQYVNGRSAVQHYLLPIHPAANPGCPAAYVSTVPAASTVSLGVVSSRRQRSSSSLLRRLHRMAASEGGDDPYIPPLPAPPASTTMPSLPARPPPIERQPTGGTSISTPNSCVSDRRTMMTSKQPSCQSIAGASSTLDALGLRRLSTSTSSELEQRRRLRINVSGQYFETTVLVLERHPDTLLGDRRKRSQFFDRVKNELFFDRAKNELFFDRHRPSFEAIFLYYQYGGRLRRPPHVPDDVFLDELLFYQLETNVVEEYKRSEGYTSEVIHLPSNKTMRRLWMLFEYPETSKTAFVIAVLSVVVTLISIVLFCVETLPMYAMTHCVAGELPNFLDVFFLIETTCTAWFTIEAIVRFVACPSKLAFWRDFKNIVDVVAVLPYYVTLFNVLSTMSCEGAKSSASLAFLRVIRLIRVFKLTKHSVGLQVLMLTFRASLEGLGLFLVALCVCLLVFSSAIYYAELGHPKTQIHSIPDAFWWAIITMTTVGYGDKVPVGYWGKLVGAACAITGVLTLAIPVPIITGHFNRFYAHKTGRGRHI